MRDDETVRRSPGGPLLPAERPLIIAHRGASTTAPEHTIAAYRAAIEQGADGVECDVRLTADGHAVCVHDRRVDRTSDGIGVVSALELADLESLDFAARRGELPTSADVDTDAHGVVTLDRLLALVHDAGRPLEIAIETKHPTRYAGRLERRVVDTLRRFGMVPHSNDFVDKAAKQALVTVRVMSFSRLGLRRVRERAPELETVLLVDRLPRGMNKIHLPGGVGTIGPSVALVDRHPDLVAHAHERGYRVHVWTVNDPTTARAYRDLGVDAVITDQPAAILAALEP